MIHHVYANRSNAGDWLSARGIQRLLSGCELREHLIDDPFVADTLAALRMAGPADLIVFGGGGLFMDYFEPFWRGFAAIAGRTPYVIWGAGLCDLKRGRSRPPRSLLAPIARGAELCVVRDELTRAYLDVDLPRPVPCPAVTAIERREMPRDGVLHSANYTTAGRAAYRAMRRHGSAFASAHGRVFRETNNRLEPGDETALERVLALYRRSDVVISSALHGCVIGLAVGARVVAVSGDRKVEGWMQAAGLDDWVLDRRDAEGVAELLPEIERQPDVRPFLTGARRENAEVARRVRALAAQAAESGAAPAAGARG